MKVELDFFMETTDFTIVNRTNVNATKYERTHTH